MSLEFMRDMDMIPMDDIDIEYSRADDMVKKIVTSFLRDENLLYWVSLIHPKEVADSLTSEKRQMNIGFSLYRCPPELLPNMMMNAFSSFSDPAVVEACGFGVSLWLARNGPEFMERVTHRAKELLGGK
jgi:hypothetical protein